jgi:selenocysteine lyase/cysteine desulfurase
MTIDLTRARAETPGCAHVAHFNNAGSSLMPQPVLDATIGYLQLEAQIGGYEAVERSLVATERPYHAIAELIGCAADEVALVENATRAWDMAFYSISFRPGDRILTSMAEYGSNYIAFLQMAQRTGAVVEAIPNDEHGQLSIAALEAMIDERVRLIAVTHVPTNGGLVNPAAAIGQVAKAAGVLFLLDACQSVGQLPIDVVTIGCDMLSATGRKYLRGPRGTGFLYVRHSLIDQLEPPFLDLHAATWDARNHYQIRPDARRFENWETNYAGKIGLGVAVDYALGWGMEAISERVLQLAAMLRECLAAIPGVRLQDLGAERCGIVTFTHDRLAAAQIKQALATQQINVSITTVFGTRLDMEQRNLPPMVRASVHYYNSEDEIDRLCHAVATLAISD